MRLLRRASSGTPTNLQRRSTVARGSPMRSENLTAHQCSEGIASRSSRMWAFAASHWKAATLTSGCPLSSRQPGGKRNRQSLRSHPGRFR